jgi:glucose/arabinose dehydrogenase
MPVSKFLLTLLVCSLVAVSLSCGGGTSTPTPPGTVTPPPAPTPPAGSTAVDLVTEQVIGNIDLPWELVFAPDGRWFFTERAGRVRVRDADGNLLDEPAFTEPTPNTEAGMLGLALDPNFSVNHFVYLFTCPTQDHCHLLRLFEGNSKLTVDKTLLELDGGPRHMAGRIKFGPDGFLYVGYGDIGNSANAQSLDNLAGKILRMTADGVPAPGNPFPEQPMIYALGFRDPQGLAWDSSNQLYGTDHGENSHDEVNIIFAGSNYGWPICEGICGNPAFVDPVKLFFPETAAPSGGTFYLANVIPQWQDSLLFGSLGLSDNTFAHHVHRIKFRAPGSREIVEEEVLFHDQFGRIRNVVQGPDNFIYFMTSNGNNNDQIIRVRPR